jgi:hypothetical protein
MRAVYLVAAELVGRGLIVSPTSRNAFGADLLVTNESCTRAYSVQVKANSQPASFWLLGEKAKRLASPTHFYVFVNFGAGGSDHEYYVVPSGVVKRRIHEDTAKTGSTWYSFQRADAAKYKDAWNLLGRVRRRAA